MFLMDNIAFIAGSGRSGTTWLQLMLGSHPAVATAQESQLFNNYLKQTSPSMGSRATLSRNI